MISGFLEPFADFPPRIRVAGGPLNGRDFHSLGDLTRACAGARRGRETYQIWARDLDWSYFAAQRESMTPQLGVLPGQGVTGLDPCPGVRLRLARPMLSDQVLERLDEGEPDPARGLAAVESAAGELAAALGVPSVTGIGGATTSAPVSYTHLTLPTNREV